MFRCGKVLGKLRKEPQQDVYREYHKHNISLDYLKEEIRRICIFAMTLSQSANEQRCPINAIVKCGVCVRGTIQ